LQKKQRYPEASLSIKNPPAPPAGTPERQKLEAEAMRQMRAARDSIDPALLERARNLILKSAPGLEEKATMAVEDEAVDKIKTLTTLKAFLLLKRDNKALCGEIRTMLTDRK
jgi:hypothetical protein